MSSGPHGWFRFACKTNKLRRANPHCTRGANRWGKGTQCTVSPVPRGRHSRCLHPIPRLSRRRAAGCLSRCHGIRSCVSPFAASSVSSSHTSSLTFPTKTGAREATQLIIERRFVPADSSGVDAPACPATCEELQGYASAGASPPAGVPDTVRRGVGSAGGTRTRNVRIRNPAPCPVGLPPIRCQKTSTRNFRPLCG